MDVFVKSLDNDPNMNSEEDCILEGLKSTDHTWHGSLIQIYILDVYQPSVNLKSLPMSINM